MGKRITENTISKWGYWQTNSIRNEEEEINFLKKKGISSSCIKGDIKKKGIEKSNFLKLLKFMKKGDTLFIKNIYYLGEEKTTILKIYEELFYKGININVMDEPNFSIKGKTTNQAKAAILLKALEESSISHERGITRRAKRYTNQVKADIRFKTISKPSALYKRVVARYTNQLETSTGFEALEGSSVSYGRGIAIEAKRYNNELKTGMAFEALQGFSTSYKGELEKDFKTLIYPTKTAILLKDLEGTGIPHGKVKMKRESRFTDPVNIAILAEKAEVKSYNSAKQKISEKIDLDKEYCKLNIFFATDRKERKRSKDKIEFTGDRNKDEIIYGKTEITIPKDHRMGEIETPWFPIFENPKKHITVSKTIILEENIFFDNIKKLDKNKALIFIHGYNVSFNDAAKRTGQLAYDLNFKGPTAFYSWPSKAKETSYAKDKTNIEWSTENIEKFLINFCERSNVKKIYVIAHSMGNLGFTKAFSDLKIKKPSLVSRFEQIILTAPDIDSDIFRDRIAPKIIGSNNTITLYTSANDLALRCSEKYNGNKRAGDSTDIIVLNGIETIDASNVDTNLMGHSYYGDETSVISDMFYIINNNLKANERSCLKKIGTENGPYWEFKK